MQAYELAVAGVVTAGAAYLGLGLVFAIAFLWRGVERMDVQAAGTSIGFRLIILPGVVAFWPLFLRRWLRGVHEPPAAANPHVSVVANHNAGRQA